MNNSYRVEAVTREPSNAVRSHDHPILESANLSFPFGRYFLDFLPGDDRSSYEITHNVEGAPLISRLLDNQQALYVCVVSSPISSYRRTHTSGSPRHKVCWELDNLGEPPLFTPMVLCNEPLQITLNSKRDGVHDIWDEQTVRLQKGSRLALGTVIQLESSILHLLSFHEDKNLVEGQFFVETETEPFRFRIRVSTRLHRFLRFPKGESHHNIMTHVVTACLARLQHDYCDDDGELGWRSHRNLLALGDHLKAEGLQHWCDDDFRPERVATELYPHVLPEDSGEGEGT